VPSPPKQGVWFDVRRRNALRFLAGWHRALLLAILRDHKARLVRGTIGCAPPRRREINFAETWSFVRCSTSLVPSPSGRSASRLAVCCSSRLLSTAGGWILCPAPSRLDQKRSGLNGRPQTLPARRERPGQADLQKLNEYWLGTSPAGRSRRQRQPDPMRGQSDGQHPLIGEDDAVALASGEADGIHGPACSACSLRAPKSSPPAGRRLA
jgi:hypothetical protein